MIDRAAYESEYAPPAGELASKWSSHLPSGKDVESFFLHELCESSESEYFLCVSDVFLDAISRQDRANRLFSLSILIGRLLDAAEFARGLTDSKLTSHFDASIDGFVALYATAASSQDVNFNLREMQASYLAIQALSMGSLPLARLIHHRHREMACINDECNNNAEIQCPSCKRYIVPYEFHQYNHNMRNVLNHPPY